MKQTKEKPFKIAFVKDLESQYLREEITYSRMVELLNEKAEAYAEQFKPALDLSEAERNVIKRVNQRGIKEISVGYPFLSNEDGNILEDIVIKFFTAYFSK